MARANPGDLVVMCVDQHAMVVAELEELTKQAQAGAHTGARDGDPDLDPTTHDHRRPRRRAPRPRARRSAVVPGTRTRRLDDTAI